MEERKLKKSALIALGSAVIISGGVIGASALISRSKLAMQNTSTVKYNKIVTVKGVAEKEVISDLGAFSVTIYCNSPNIPEGYRELSRINDILNKKLAELGIQAAEIQNPSLSYTPVYETITIKESNNKSETRTEFKHYRFFRSCRIISGNVEILENASLKLYDLIQQGIEIDVENVQFFIKDPEQYKLDLIDRASASAYQRAIKVAETSGAELGTLLIARQGVIQITRPASNDTSSYGVYDTTTLRKVMRLVVTLEYSLKDED